MTKTINNDSKVSKAKIKKNRIKWVKALLGGRYKQTTGRLCREVGPESFKYCCLGVAYATFRVKKVKFVEITGVESIKFEERLYDLSDNLRVKLGLSDELHNELVSMNDADEKSFREIGKFLQRKWKITNKELGLADG
jgi:hypothetical protein